MEAWFLGGASLERDGEPVEGPANQAHRLALLALLAAHPHGELPRSRAIGLLWPERDETSARHLLSESLYVLRKAAGSDAILSVGDRMRLNPSRIWTDVRAFEEALAGDDPAAALALYEGPFLEGVHLARSSEMEWWVEQERQRLSRSFSAAAEAAAREAEARGDLAEAVGFWEQLWRQDPFSDRATLGLMRALTRSGQRATALAVGTEHRHLMGSELGTDAAEEVLGYLDEISSRPPADATAGREPDDARPYRNGLGSVPHHGPSEGSRTARRGAGEPPVEGRPPRPRRVAPYLVLLLGTAAAVAWILVWPIGSAPEALVVRPFRACSGPDTEPLARTLSLRLAEEARQRLGLRVPPLPVVAQMLAEVGDEGILSALEVAETLGADLVLTGCVRQTSDRRLELQMDLWSVGNAESPVEVHVVHGEVGRVGEFVLSAAEHLPELLGVRTLPPEVVELREGTRPATYSAPRRNPSALPRRTSLR